ncbi:hypothetical protein KCU62_g681, partial [Aureobasidium sp. EXF-3399]
MNPNSYVPTKDLHVKRFLSVPEAKPPHIHAPQKAMAKQSTPPTPSTSHSGPHRLPPITPVSKPPEPKALTPSNKLHTYKQCLRHDNLARNTAIAAFKATDTYIYQMCHYKRYTMLAAIAAEVDAKRIEAGEHVSCLFEKVEMTEAPLSPEEAMEKWVDLRKEVQSKRSGLRGRVERDIRMLPKKEVAAVKSLKEQKERVKEEQNKMSEGFTSKGIPLVMIGDDDDDDDDDDD